MKNKRQIIWILACCLVALSAMIVTATAPRIPIKDALRLEMLRKKPVKYTKLLQQAEVFSKLPEEEQSRLRKLDADFRKLPGVERKHLKVVMKNYSEWLARLPAEQRQRITKAPTNGARIDLVRQIHEEEWIKTLPKVHREALARADHVTRLKLIDDLRRKEKRWKARWKIAVNHWQDIIRKKPLPESLQDYERLDKNVYQFIHEYLKPHLPIDEWERLENAKGWPRFPCTLVDLADRYPIALKGETGPTTIQELPIRLRARLKNLKKAGVYRRRLREAEGKWPEFAVAVTQIMKDQKLNWVAYELWPTHHEYLSIPMRGFVTDKLIPLLNKDEKFQLEMAEGSWPAYPAKIQLLADDHALKVPWQTLPGPRSRWNSYRVKNWELIGEW